MKTSVFISFLFIFVALSVKGQQKVSSLKNGGDDGFILTTPSDTVANNDVVPVSLSSDKMPLPGGDISPLKTQSPPPKNHGAKNAQPVKASDKITAPKGK